MLELFVFWLIFGFGVAAGVMGTVIAYARNDIQSRRRNPPSTQRISTLDLFELPESLRHPPNDPS